MGGVSQLGFAPQLPTPQFGDFTQLNTMFTTTLGPSGMLGMTGLPATVSGSFSGVMGGDMGGLSQARVPQYRTVYDKVPVYHEDVVKAEDYKFDQGFIQHHVDVQTQVSSRAVDPVIIDLDADGALGVTGKDVSSQVIEGSETVSTSTDTQRVSQTQEDTTTTITREWDTRENWNNKIDYDVDADGKVDRTEWLKQGTGDAFLVMDLNADGNIDGKELMNETGVNGEQKKYASGWDKARDLADRNGDGILEGNELVGLKVWNDKNADGKVDSGEMKTMADANIVKIDTNKGEVSRKKLTGYKTVPRQELAGYYEFSAYASMGGSNVGLNFIPAAPGQSTSEMMGGFSAYAQAGSTVQQNGYAAGFSQVNVTGANGGNASSATTFNNSNDFTAVANATQPGGETDGEFQEA